MKQNHKNSFKKSLLLYWENTETYEKALESEEFVNSPHRQKACSFVSPDGLILDLGCGRGANAVHLRDCRYVGLDISFSLLPKISLQSRCFVNGDAELLPFRDQTFDGVIATFVLEHSTDPQRLLSEVCRVVRQGGRIVLLGPSWDFPWWYPNSLRSQVGSSSLKRLKYTVKRFIGQIIGWLFGLLPFHTISDPDCLRNEEFVHDADAVYVVWAWEVVKFMSRLGCHLIHWEVDDRLLGHRWFVRLLKHFLLRLPLYQYAGSTLFLVFERVK
jgi:SAM-dependent methyltransferase